MDKSEKERKEYQSSVNNLEKALHEFENAIKIMANCIDFDNFTTGELHEITALVLRLAKDCKKIANMAKKHKSQAYAAKVEGLSNEDFIQA